MIASEIVSWSKFTNLQVSVKLASHAIKNGCQKSGLRVIKNINCRPFGESHEKRDYRWKKKVNHETEKSLHQNVM